MEASSADSWQVHTPRTWPTLGPPQGGGVCGKDRVRPSPLTSGRVALNASTPPETRRARKVPICPQSTSSFAHRGATRSIVVPVTAKRSECLQHHQEQTSICLSASRYRLSIDIPTRRIDTSEVTAQITHHTSCRRRRSGPREVRRPGHPAVPRETRPHPRAAPRQVRQTTMLPRMAPRPPAHPVLLAPHSFSLARCFTSHPPPLPSLAMPPEVAMSPRP
jgi:hypothetical protein